MQAEMIALSKYRLEKSKEDLFAARTTLEAGQLAVSVNRSYYAMFHATRALLAMKLFDSKKHSTIIGFFNQHYIATNKIDVRFHKMLAKAFKIRNNTDYEDFFKVSKDMAYEQCQNATEFINMIECFLKEGIIDG